MPHSDPFGMGGPGPVMELPTCPDIEVRETCIPPKASHHAKKIVNRGGFASLADKPELEAAKASWDTLFWPHKPSEPLCGPLALSLELRWPHNAGQAKKRLHMDIPMDVQPDLDNLAKTVIDRLVFCGYLKNDSQIVDLHVRKWKSPNPGVVLKIWLV